MKWSRTKETKETLRSRTKKLRKQAHFSPRAFSLALSSATSHRNLMAQSLMNSGLYWNVTFLVRPSLTVHLKLQPDPHTLLLPS